VELQVSVCLLIAWVEKDREEEAVKL